MLRRMGVSFSQCPQQSNFNFASDLRFSDVRRLEAVTNEFLLKKEFLQKNIFYSKKSEIPG